MSSQSSSGSSSSTSNASSISRAASRSSSVISVGSEIIDDLIRDEVRYAHKPDGLPTGPFGQRRESWDSFRSVNLVDVTPTQLKARHRLHEHYQRKLTPALQTTMQAFAPQDKLAKIQLHLRHTPKESGQRIDDLRYFAHVGTGYASFRRNLAKRNRVADPEGSAAACLGLVSGTRDRYRIRSTRHCKSVFHIGDEALFKSIGTPGMFVHKVGEAIPVVLKAHEIGLKGTGIGDLGAGIKNKFRHNRRPNATTQKQELKTLCGAPVIQLDATDTYDLEEADKAYDKASGLKAAEMTQTLARCHKGQASAAEEYDESLKKTGSKIVRTIEHFAGDESMDASAVLLKSMRDAHGVTGIKKKKTASHKTKTKIAQPAQT